MKTIATDISKVPNTYIFSTIKNTVKEGFKYTFILNPDALAEMESWFVYDQCRSPMHIEHKRYLDTYGPMYDESNYFRHLFLPAEKEYYVHIDRMSLTNMNPTLFIKIENK